MTMWVSCNHCVINIEYVVRCYTRISPMSSRHFTNLFCAFLLNSSPSGTSYKVLTPDQCVSLHLPSISAINSKTDKALSPSIYQ